MENAVALPAAVPVLADYDSVIDTTRTGSVTLHKIIENDGNNKQADGHEDASLRNAPLDKIEFSYIKIANWLMDADDLCAKSTTGLYYTDLDPGIFGEGGIARKAGINVTVNPTVFSHEVTLGSAEDRADGREDGQKTTTVYTTKAIGRLVGDPGRAGGRQQLHGRNGAAQLHQESRDKDDKDRRGR